MCDRAQPRFLFLEPKVGVDVNDAEAFAVVRVSVKNRESISDSVLDETLSNQPFWHRVVAISAVVAKAAGM